MPTQTPSVTDALDFVIDREKTRFTASPDSGWQRTSADGTTTASDLVAVLEAAGTVAATAGERAMRRARDTRVGRSSYKDAYRRNDRSDEVIAVHMRTLQAAVEGGSSAVAKKLAQQVTEAFDLLDYADIADMLKISHQAAINYNSRGVLPPAILYKGGSPLWARRQIREWIPTRRGLDWRKGQSGPAGRTAG